MEWGNCHLDSMSDSEKAQLVGLVEGAPWQSYTNLILSFSCFFFFLGHSFTSLSVFGALSAHSLSTINTTDNLSAIFMKLKTDGEWEICSFVLDKPGHEDNVTFFRTSKILMNISLKNNLFFFFAKPDSVYNLGIKHWTAVMCCWRSKVKLLTWYRIEKKVLEELQPRLSHVQRVLVNPNICNDVWFVCPCRNFVPEGLRVVGMGPGGFSCIMHGSKQ